MTSLGQAAFVLDDHLTCGGCHQVGHATAGCHLDHVFKLYEARSASGELQLKAVNGVLDLSPDGL